MLLQRERMLSRVRRALGRSPVVALLGARQCGKTTLARTLVSPESPNYFDLEDPRSLVRLEEPLTALGELRGTVVLDEVQHRPDLFPILRVLVDRPNFMARFLVLGSAGPNLLRQSSESLAGRLETVALSGFDLSEVGPEKADQLWLRGGFPRSFLAQSDEDSREWRVQFVNTFLLRDLPQAGIALPAPAMMRIWSMLAHYHGQTWNGAEIARSSGVGEHSVRRYVDALTGLFLLRQLQPWHANLSKRQVRAPKVYVRDSGLLHTLLAIRDERDLQHHPRLGSSWEGFALEQTLGALQPDQAYFWATHSGAELDLLIVHGLTRIGFEFKRADAPGMTRSMGIALQDLSLDRLFVVYPGPRRYRIREQVTALPLREFADPESVRELAIG